VVAAFWNKTPSMFQRYNVTSATDQIEALKKTAAHLAALPKTDEKTVLECPKPLLANENRQNADSPTRNKKSRSPRPAHFLEILVAGARNQHYLQLWRPAA
jgi:hypothetical protein